MMKKYDRIYNYLGLDVNNNAINTKYKFYH